MDRHTFAYVTAELTYEKEEFRWLRIRTHFCSHDTDMENQVYGQEEEVSMPLSKADGVRTGPEVSLSFLSELIQVLGPVC